MGVGLSAGSVIVAQLNIPQQKDPLPGHQHIIEENDGIHLLETGTQGMIKVGTAHVEALPAEKLQAGSVAGDREGERVAPGVVTQPMAGHGIDGDLIGDGPQRRQHPATPYHKPGIGLLHRGQRHLFAKVSCRAWGTAPLQVHQCVGESHIVLTDEFVVIDDVLLELRPVLGKVIRRSSPGGKDDIEEVGGASHHAAGSPGPAGHHVAPPLQVFDGLGDQERKTHRLAGGGRSVGHLLLQLRVMLHVVQGRHRPDPVGQGRMGSHVLDTFALYPHLPRPFLEAGDVFLSCTCWHCSSSFLKELHRR